MEYKFIATIRKNRFDGDNFKIYVCETDTPGVPRNNRGELIIVGDTPQLESGAEYVVVAIQEVNKTFGNQYKVKSIRRNLETNLEGARAFLAEILTPNQTENLLAVHPNIIDMVIQGKPVDLTNVKGVKDKTFAVISRKIIENFGLIELVEKFGGIMTFNMLKKMFDHFENINVLERELKDNPYECLCQLSRVGFKIADTLVLEMNKKNVVEFKSKNMLTSIERMEAAVKYVLEENANSGSTRMDGTKLQKEAIKLAPECKSHFGTIIRDGEARGLYVDMKNKKVALLGYYRLEVEVANRIQTIMMESVPTNMNVAPYISHNGITLTDEQQVVLHNVNKYGVSLLTAPAGAGKSQSIANLIAMLEGNHKTFKILSPIGKSSKVIQEFTGRPASTIHRGLLYNPKENTWGYDEDNQLPEDYVIVDEAGMMDLFLFNRVLKAINPYKTKLLLVFDSFQLASVSLGNVVHDMMVSGKIPTSKLTKVFRYGEGGLMNVATKIRNGEQFMKSGIPNGATVFGSKKDFIYVETPTNGTVAMALKVYKKILSDGYNVDDILVVVSQNKGDLGTVAINKCIQEELNKDKKNFLTYNGEKSKLYVSDKVVQIANNYKAPTESGGEVAIFNGNTGIVTEIVGDNVYINFDGVIVVYAKSTLISNIQLGYCLSCHKSQGSGYKQVIVIAPRSHSFMLNNNLLYTAITRTKQRCYLIGNIGTINRSIKERENINRDTFLSELLIEKISK